MYFFSLILIFIGLILLFFENIKVYFQHGKDYWNKNKLEILLIICLSFVPIRLYSIFKINNPIIYFSLWFFVLLAFFFKGSFIPRLFNSMLFQSFLFLVLLIENFLLWSPVITFVIFLWIGSFLARLEPLDFLFYYSFFLFLIGLHLRLKSLVLNADEICPDLGLEKDEDLKWEKITLFYSSFLEKTYKKPFVSKLPIQLNSVAFPNSARRYMWKRSLQHVGEHKEAYGLAVTGVGLLGGGIGFGIETTTRRMETESNERLETKKLDIELKKLEEVREARQQAAEQAAMARRFAYCKHRDETITRTDPSLIHKPEKLEKARVIFDSNELNQEILKQKTKTLSCIQNSSFWDFLFS